MDDRALPQQQREIINLKFEAGLSYKEIAEAMRMSVSSVGVSPALRLTVGR
jgi:DNA-directed RNA polymerase specialized sigma24 family protein